MGILDIFRRRAKILPPESWGFSASFGPGAYPVTKNPTATLCESKIASTIANLPLSLYVRKRGGGRAPALFNPLFFALQRPTSGMTRYLHVYTWVQDMLEGNAYLMILRSAKGEPVGFQRIDPTSVTVSIDHGQKVFRSAGKTYTTDDILHIPYPLNFDGIIGESPRYTYREIIAIDNQLTEYIQKYFENSVGTRIGIELDETWKKDGVEKAYLALAPIMAKFVTGAMNAGKPFITPPGSKLSKIEQSSNAETDLRSLKVLVERQIAQGFMVPYELISGENPYNSLEQRQLAFLSDCISPLCTHIQESFDSLLSPQDRQSLYTSFDFKTLIRTDIKTTIETLDRELKIGLLNLNEARAKLDENSIGDVGDYHFFPANMYPLTEENVAAFFAMSKKALSASDPGDHNPAGDDKK